MRRFERAMSIECAQTDSEECGSFDGHGDLVEEEEDLVISLPYSVALTNHVRGHSPGGGTNSTRSV